MNNSLAIKITSSKGANPEKGAKTNISNNPNKTILYQTLFIDKSSIILSAKIAKLKV